MAKSIFLLAITIAISLIGLLFVFESSVAESFSTFGHPYHYAQAQAVSFAIGLAALFVASFFPIKLWRALSPALFLIALISLILVFIPGIGLRLNGANRWFSLFGLVTIQPVEYIKFALVVFLAALLSKHQRLATFLLLTSIPTALLIAQPDLGSTLIFLAIAFGLFFVAGGKMKYIFIIGGLGLTLVTIATLSSTYRMKRISTFLNPELDPLGSSLHIRQITLALGRGGLIGQGFGESKQKYSYIPEASSDSILAIVAEEIGFVGVTAIVCLYWAYFICGYKIATSYPTHTFEFLLAAGLMLWISAQTLLNIAAVVALVPLTGIPLPFFSYGGSSLVMVMLATGVLIKLGKKSSA